MRVPGQTRTRVSTLVKFHQLSLSFGQGLTEPKNGRKSAEATHTHQYHYVSCELLHSYALLTLTHGFVMPILYLDCCAKKTGSDGTSYCTRPNQHPHFDMRQGHRSFDQSKQDRRTVSKKIHTLASNNYESQHYCNCLGCNNNSLASARPSTKYS